MSALPNSSANAPENASNDTPRNDTVKSVTDPWLKIRPVAEQLGTTLRTVREEIQRGNLEAVRIAGRYRIRQSEVDAYLTRNKVTAKGAGRPVVTVPSPRDGVLS